MSFLEIRARTIVACSVAFCEYFEIKSTIIKVKSMCISVYENNFPGLLVFTDKIKVDRSGLTDLAERNILAIFEFLFFADAD